MDCNHVLFGVARGFLYIRKKLVGAAENALPDQGEG